MDDRDTANEQPATDQQPEKEQPLPLDPASQTETTDDPVEDASADSFPASDPPSFTRSTSD